MTPLYVIIRLVRMIQNRIRQYHLSSSGLTLMSVIPRLVRGIQTKINPIP